MTQINQQTSIFIQMAVYYFIITNVRYGTTTSDTTCTRINNDCSGWTTWLYRYKKKKNQVQGPIWIPIIRNPSLPWKSHWSDMFGQMNVKAWTISRTASVVISKLDSVTSRNWGSPSSKCLQVSFQILGGWHTIATLMEGERKGTLVMYSNRANSAGHLAIYKVVLRYQWDMLAL